MGNRSMFVGLDVHKETIDVSIAEGDRHGEVRHYGVIKSDLEPLDKVVRARAGFVPLDARKGSICRVDTNIKHRADTTNKGSSRASLVLNSDADRPG